MLVRLSPIDPKTYRFRVNRSEPPEIDQRLERRSMLVHDLCHFAIEATRGIDDGFFGLLATGCEPSALREGSPSWPRLLEVERLVVRLQTAFRKDLPAEDTVAMGCLRRLHGAWRKVGMGEELCLRWPDPNDIQVLPSGA